MRRPSAVRRWITALSWPFGIALTCWDYMWRITPLHRSEVVEARTEPHLPPAWPAGVKSDEVIGPPDGHGPLFHRRYGVRIEGAAGGPEELMDALTANLNRAAPTTFARFHKVLGGSGQLAVGDEYLVRMPGPWDGPVRVIARDRRSFRLATLAGHLESGQIEFRARGDDADGLRFEIESWARSASRLSHLLYHRLRMAKEVQFHMWVSFLERTAKLARGKVRDGVVVETVRVEALR